MSVKLVVLYPYPQDQEAFEKAYTTEHMPVGRSKFDTLHQGGLYAGVDVAAGVFSLLPYRRIALSFSGSTAS